MSGTSDPASWVERLLGWCLGILLATVALYCAVQLIEAILPTLIIAAGIAGLAALGVVVYRTTRNGW